MKLKNKKTGEIVVFGEGIVDLRNIGCKNVAEMLEAGWEDYEEPKEYWYIDYGGRIKAINDANDEEDLARKEIGNYFETKEEAELAVRKLKAWKRLKDEGMRIFSFKKEKGGIDLDYYTLTILAPRDKESLDLLFGGEE